jgi:hypothetical protein
LREHVSFVSRRCTEPNPEDRRSEGIRIANDAKPSKFVSFFDRDLFQVYKDQFLMPKV